MAYFNSRETGAGDRQIPESELDARTLGPRQWPFPSPAWVMNNFAWFLACAVISVALFGLARRLGFKSGFRDTFQSLWRIVAIAPVVLVTSMLAGTFGAPVLFLGLWLLEIWQVVPTVWLRTMSIWVFTFGAIVVGYLLMFCWMCIGNWRDSRSRAL